MGAIQFHATYWRDFECFVSVDYLSQLRPSLSPLDLLLAVVAQERAEHRQGEVLRRVGLRRGHAVPRVTRLDVAAALRLPGDVAAHNVGDPDAETSVLSLAVLQRRHGVLENSIGLSEYIPLLNSDM